MRKLLLLLILIACTQQIPEKPIDCALLNISITDLTELPTQKQQDWRTYPDFNHDYSFHYPPGSGVLTNYKNLDSYSPELESYDNYIKSGRLIAIVQKDKINLSEYLEIPEACYGKRGKIESAEIKNNIIHIKETNSCPAITGAVIETRCYPGRELYIAKKLDKYFQLSCEPNCDYAAQILNSIDTIKPENTKWSIINNDYYWLEIPKYWSYEELASNEQGKFFRITSYDPELVDYFDADSNIQIHVHICTDEKACKFKDNLGNEIAITALNTSKYDSVEFMNTTSKEIVIIKNRESPLVIIATSLESGKINTIWANAKPEVIDYYMGIIIEIAERLKVK